MEIIATIMFPYLLLAIASFFPLQAQADNRIVFESFKPVVAAREDPLIFPGIVSQHAHHVVGASSFNITYDADKQRAGQCTNLPIQADMSNYWQPMIYRVLNNNSYQAMQTGSRIYYFIFNETNSGMPLIPFPYDFRMVAGNPARKTKSDDEADLWESYYCDQGNSGFMSFGLPTVACDWLVSKVFFPSCWNGQEYNISNPGAHMQYPIDGFAGVDCPVGFRAGRVPGILLESTFYNANQPATDASKPQYILANGDTTGYGLHADFANGWNMDVATAMVRDCSSHDVIEPPNEACAALAPSYSVSKSENCFFQGKIPNEPVGYSGALEELPGCNLPWGNTTTKPTCSPKIYKGDPGFVYPKTKNLWQWSLTQAY